MKKNLSIFLLSAFIISFSSKAFSQNLDIVGKLKIGTVEKNNNSDSILVRLQDGTLAIREISSFSFGSNWVNVADTLYTLKHIGIGTTSPKEKLHIKGNQKIEGRIEIVNSENDPSIYIGLNSGVNDSGTDNRNTAIGANTLYNNTTGAQNTAIGYQNLYTNTTGSQNTAIGYQNLYSNTIGYFAPPGYQNTAIGIQCLYSNTYGEGNIAIGTTTLFSNTTGSFNSAIGVSTLRDNTTGHSNTSMGRETLVYNTSGSYNTAFGSNALNSNITGNSNTAIGYGADVSSGNLGNATALGYGAKTNSSNKVRIGNNHVTIIEGEVAFNATSDKRLKEEITTVVLGKQFINDLNPVQYHRVNNDKKDVEMGIIAQELLEVLEHHGMSNSGMVNQPRDTGQYMSVRYNDLFAPIIRAVQELSDENEKLKKEIKRIAELEKSMEALKAMLPTLK